MLLLTRKKGESIIIGNDIKITCCGIKNGSQAIIGIEAPMEFTVHREEVYLRRLQENGINLDSVDFKSQEYQQAAYLIKQACLKKIEGYKK